MNLYDILAKLTMFCRNATGDDIDIKIILPDKVIDQFNLSLNPKELIQPGTPSNGTYSFGCKLYTHSGTAELFRDSDFVVDTRLEEETE
jgi:hypothetical protein